MELPFDITATKGNPFTAQTMADLPGIAAGQLDHCLARGKAPVSFRLIDYLLCYSILLAESRV